MNVSELQALVDAETARHGVDILDVASRENTSALRNCRRSIARRCRDELDLSYHDIGQVLGGRHHTTVMSILGELGWQR